MTTQEWKKGQEILTQLKNEEENKLRYLLDFNIPWWRGHPEFVQHVLMFACCALGIKLFLRHEKLLIYIREYEYGAAAEWLKRTYWFRRDEELVKSLSKTLATGRIV